MAKKYEDLSEDDYEKRSTEVDGKTIYYKYAQTEWTEQEFSKLADKDCKFIFESLLLADALLQQYAKQESLKNYSFHSLDMLIDMYNDDPAQFDCAENEFINSIGSAFGHLLNKNVGTKWTIITDEYGEAYACQIDEISLRAFPFHSVFKAIKQKREGSLETIYQMFKEQKEILEKEQ